MSDVPEPIYYKRSPSPLYNFRYPKPFNDKYIFSLIKIFILTKKFRLSASNNNLDCTNIIKIIKYYHNSDNTLASEKFKKELFEIVYHKKHRNVGLFIGMNLSKHWELLNWEDLEKPFGYNLNNKKKPNPKIITNSWIKNNINIYPGS